MKHLFYRCNIHLDFPSASRLLLIAANSSLATVHEIIQLAFELDNEKDFQFYDGKLPYAPRSFQVHSFGTFKPLDSNILLSMLKPKNNTVLSYLYDTSKPFLFHITIEKLCSADTASTSPRLLQKPDEVNTQTSPFRNNENALWDTLFGNEFF